MDNISRENIHQWNVIYFILVKVRGGPTTMSSTRRKELEPKYYLPKFARKSKRAKVRQIGYSVEKDPVTSVITFQYTVTWTDFDNRMLRRYEVLKRMLGAKEATVAHNDGGNPTLPRLIQCDGACNAWAPEDYIIQFGLCDHNVCFKCYENEESISLMGDGSHGCCNKECVKRAKAELSMKSESGDSQDEPNENGKYFYSMFPGTKHKSSDAAKSSPSGKNQKIDLDEWRSKLKAVGSDVSYYGSYDDAELQEMAEEILSSAAVDEQRGGGKCRSDEGDFSSRPIHAYTSNT
ncbi:hypothetical protein DICVIV_05754 [Dictyocaulus viviparus]|uniref:Uncharacterized protein n=1 Tax=Dictyocaulus viviparus TaxID=29172 RepID=A0A0D8XUD7_DICVI|nr:hypothetical protein DICVIV_05754 [Dictyocaulus viviparus]